MATIGIDLTPVQGPHRMRGVGSTVINILRHMPDEYRKVNHFVFYLYEFQKQEALDLIDASLFPNYETRVVTDAPPLPPSIKTVHGLLYMPKRLMAVLADRRLGTKRIIDTDNIDVFLQFEQDITPPPGIKSVIIAYDLIPYVLENDYLWGYNTARRRHGYSRRGALKAQVRRSTYLSRIRNTMRRASKVIAISEHTKQDFTKYVGVPNRKMEVCHLGVSDKRISQSSKPNAIYRYINTSWGDVRVITNLPDTQFLLFVGGADPRRKLADLVYAFNLLRAQGHKLYLVLAGDTMLGPNSVPNAEARKALLSSSYLDDIYMLGFIDDSTREWLYKNALAFVYPSRYEGFGLPILEAMRYGTPVITYKNSSIEEIAGENALYASSFESISLLTKKILSFTDKERNLLANEGIKHATGFMWEKAAERILNITLQAID